MAIDQGASVLHDRTFHRSGYYGPCLCVGCCCCCCYSVQAKDAGSTMARMAISAPTVTESSVGTLHMAPSCPIRRSSPVGTGPCTQESWAHRLDGMGPDPDEWVVGFF